MEQVAKVFFNPLATNKAQIQAILESLPVGSAHPFSSERILLCRTADCIIEIDISSYPEEYFFNAVDLGGLGETLLRRMAGFAHHLETLSEYSIQQVPASTFKVPIISDQIAIFAVSEKNPTFYDFCLADAEYNTCCWAARNTFPGISHSGDIPCGQDLLHYIKMNEHISTEKEIVVFISGYSSTKLTRFLGTNPALLVANHAEKALYIVPVPLDAATIGEATICCPLVVKRDGDLLLCSVLPAPTTNTMIMCSTSKLKSSSFPEAIQRADFNMTVHNDKLKSDEASQINDTIIGEARNSTENAKPPLTKKDVVIGTRDVSFPSIIDQKTYQVIRFGTGIEFEFPGQEQKVEKIVAQVILPCIFGSQLEGPVLLATGVVPSNVPFSSEKDLQAYYERLNSVVVVVNDRMTDNARNLAGPMRINALFIIEVAPEKAPKDFNDVLSLLDSVNINAVTALAGPQSLVLVHMLGKYHFYRGLANRTYLNASNLAFGSDVTSIIESIAVETIIDPRVRRLINLDEAKTILLPNSGREVSFQDLEKLFEELPVDQIELHKEDISAAVPQLQALLNQKDLRELSNSLISKLSAKVSQAIEPMRAKYIEFLTREYQITDPQSRKQKNAMIGDLRKCTKKLQQSLESVISSLANMMSTQTTSKRAHDLKRLLRQTKIQRNVEVAQNMTFETIGGYLENYASDMGVMLLNIETEPYIRLLGNLNNVSIDADSCCDLDSRVLHLEGFDAGIIIEQAQGNHRGPLTSQLGPQQPVLALPYLNQERGRGSMLAWACWDEFVDLENPFSVRWIEKCNDAHIAALRIIMRSTLSHAVASREHNLQPGSWETGLLMSALLMAGMSKLAAMRNTAPTVVLKAEDTVTRLMRGLFGNLLTTAGSGVRPLSMVWQLFGTNPQFDIPSTDVAWFWYKTVVALYPYTGWPLEQFYGNLEGILNKVIMRLITKNELVDGIKASRMDEMIKYCKLRNIQLNHSRTILTILMRLLKQAPNQSDTLSNSDGIDCKAVAARLLEKLPHELQKQTKSYAIMIRYLEHLAEGGKRREDDDLVVASVYNKRSGAFRELKSQVSEACKAQDGAKIKESCQKLLAEYVATAALWKIDPESLKVQNMGAYKDLLDAEFGEDIDQETKNKNQHLFMLVIGDAEKTRIPWQVGKESQFGDNIEPIDEAFVHEILTGESLAADDASNETPVKDDFVAQTEPKGFARFSKTVKREFLAEMNKNLSMGDVCKMLGVPVHVMQVFAKALNPDFVWEDLGENFKVTILELLEDKSGRNGSRPVRILLCMDCKFPKTLEEKEEEQLQIVFDA